MDEGATALAVAAISGFAAIVASLIPVLARRERWTSEVDRSLDLLERLERHAETPNERLAVQLLRDRAFESAMRGMGYEWSGDIIVPKRIHLLSYSSYVLASVSAGFIALAAGFSHAIAISIPIFAIAALCAIWLFSRWPKSPMNPLYMALEGQRTMLADARMAAEALKNGFGTDASGRSEREDVHPGEGEGGRDGHVDDRPFDDDADQETPTHNSPSRRHATN